MFSGVITVTAVWNHRDRETDREREREKAHHAPSTTHLAKPPNRHAPREFSTKKFFFLSFSLALCNFVSPPSDDSHSVMCNQN